MRAVFTEPFRRDYAALPPRIQRALDKALGFLIQNPHHSSLRAKKLSGTSIWYARVSRAHRFTFQLDGGIVILRRIGTHNILNSERKRII